MPLKTVFISGIPEPTHDPLTHHIIMNIFDTMSLPMALTDTKFVNPTANEIKTRGNVIHIRY